MKKNVLLIAMVALHSLCAIAQTNVINTTGNVGIGTLNPYGKLHVKGGISLQNTSIPYDPIATTYDRAGIFFGANHSTANTMFWISPDATLGNRLNIGTGNSYNDTKSKITLLYDGRLGLGSISPSEKFQIGEMNNQDKMKIFIPGRWNFEGVRLGQFGNGVNGDTGNGACALELVNHNNATQSYGVRLLTDVDKADDGIQVLGLQIQTASPSTAYSTLAYSTKMVILNDGKVGIGTKTPSSKLQVVSPAISESNNATTYPGLLIESTSTTRTIGEGAAIGFVLPANTDGTNPHQQGRILVTPNDINNNSAAGRMYLQTRYWTGTNSDWRNNLVLLSNGFVGIGTDSPDKELTVKGTIHAREVIVDMQGPLADYVFEPTYNLKPLAEVEKFVKEEKHLPEMPSAAEVADKGMNMGEMQNLLLQKVEELTLYLIEQQKVMQLQQAQIDELKKQVAEKNMATK